MDTETFELAKSQADVCRIFGNARRVLILWTLGEREMSVSAIAAAIDTSLQNTSQHLRLMKDRGVLSSRRAGNTVYYQVKPNELLDGCRLLTQAQQCAPTAKQAPLYYKHDYPSDKEKIPMATDDLTSVVAAKVVDARAMACPGPLLEAKKSIGAVNVGEVLEIWSGDARTKDDMPKWCKKVGHEFLGILVAEGGYDRIFIQRSK